MTQALLPLQFHVKAGNWKRFEKRKKTANYQRIHEIILAEHNHKCAYCGYACDELELVNKNFDYEDRTRENIVPACAICQPIVLVDGFGQEPKFQGTIIYLPELSQIQLNHLVRASLAIMHKNNPYQSKMNELLISFEERKEYLEKILGKNSHKPEYFSQGLLDIFITEKKMMHPIFKTLRYLPDKSVLKNKGEQYSKIYFLEK